MDNHKHLGLTFSSDCKWHTHIDNILASVSGPYGCPELYVQEKLNTYKADEYDFLYHR